MSENHASSQPTPQPLCAIYEPMLPLLAADGLTAEERASLQEHLARCAWCQNRLATLDVVDAALRRHYASVPAAPAGSGSRSARTRPALTLEDIMKADQRETTTPPREASPAPRAFSLARKRRLAALGAVAAVLVLTVLAASLFAYFGSSPSAVPTPRPTPVPLHTYPLPATITQPGEIIARPQGPLWLGYSGGIARIDVQGNSVAFTPYAVSGGVLGICLGPDGAIWFTEWKAAKIGRIGSDGTIQEFSLPSGQSTAGSITPGPDGALWFSLSSAIGRITTTGAVTLFSLPSPIDGGELTAGPDGAIWFLDSPGARIGRMTLAGSVTEFAVPSSDAQFSDIVAGPDGALWFPEGPNGAIGRITTSGEVTEFPVTGQTDWLEGITVGPDKALWFGAATSHRVRRITTRGQVTGDYYVSPMLRKGAFLSLTATNNAIWFTLPDTATAAVGRIDVKAA